MQENHNESNILTIENQKTVSMTGVKSVSAFSAQQIVLELAVGKVTLTGNHLKITDFSKETGKFLAEGEVYGAKFSSSTGKLKLFK